MKTFLALCDFLNNENILFQTKNHEPTLTSEDSARIRGDLLSQGAKAILYKVEEEFCLFVFAAQGRMDTKKIKAYFKSQGKRVKKTRFATKDELMKMTGLVPGSVPPFGRPILDFDLYVDPSLTHNSSIAFNAGSLCDSITMSLDDYLKISKPVLFNFVIDE